MSFTIFVTAPTLGASGLEILRASGSRLIFLNKGDGQPEVDAILRREKVDGLVLRTFGIDGAAMTSCPTLKVISRHGAGWNTVDVDNATKHGIPVLIAAGGNANSVAELAIGLMLSVSRSIAAHDRALRAGNWTPNNGRQLGGRTLGIVGLGAVGRAVAQIAAAMGMRVIAFDAFVKPELVPAHVRMVASLDALLAESNVVSLHAPLVPETRGLMGAAQFAAMREGAILINTARGPLVDESALIEALSSGRLAGAGIDTFAKEPLAPDHPLTKLPNVVMTPHVGGSTDMAIEAVAAAAAEHALAVLRGESVDPSVCVNPNVLKKREEA